ncbi:chaplin family protein [Agromyces sp. MMS24-K17]|uniref:chaplin family protein n=1 Tax=Agromyces sp. MMS24-K17 TaxID=3372850 RepID=UPI0037545CE8
MDLKRFATRALYATLLTGGLTLLGAGVANAAETSGDDGILSGTQLGISIDLPITVSGNGISVLGDASSTDASTGSPAATGAPAPAAVTGGDDSLGSGTQALVDVSVPITIGGNAISVLGDATSDGAATAPAAAAPAPAAPAASPDAPAATTSGDDSLLGATQALVDMSVPVTIGGNAISVIGDSESTDASTAAGTAGPGTGSGAGTAGSAPSTSGDDSLLGGTQVVGDIVAPILVGGNAISVIGDSASTDASTEAGTAGTAGTGAGTGGAAPATGGDDSVLGGTQLLPMISLPITVGGNAISVIGDTRSDGSTAGADQVDPTDPTFPTDPADPGDPAVPGTPGDGTDGADASEGGSSVAGSGSVAVIAAGDDEAASLASTGVETGTAGLAALAVLAGLVLVGLRRFAVRR